MTERIDWKAFACLVEGELERGYFVRSDLEEAFSSIRSIVTDNLEVYVDKPFISNFRLNIKSSGRIILIDLVHEFKTLCHWEISCRI